MQPSRHRTQLTSLHSKHLPPHIVQNQILRTAEAACSSIFARCIYSMRSSVWKIRRRLGQEGEFTDFEPLLPIPANDFLAPQKRSSRIFRVRLRKGPPESPWKTP